ncbi:MAG: oligopeptide ABC transporter permease [Bacillus sp. (in: firmicutes)]
MAETNYSIPKEKFQKAIIEASEAEIINKPSLNFWQDSWLRVRKNKAAVISLFIIIILVAMALVGPLISGRDGAKQNVNHANLPAKIPMLENVTWLPFDGTQENKAGITIDYYEMKKVPEDMYYWFGTDGLGRDLFTRLWEGAQISLYIAMLAALIDLVVGVAYGSISGYFGGRIDTVMQRITEVIMGIPNLIVVVLMILVLEPGILSITIALSITGWVTMARVVRAQVMKLKEQEFVLASRTLGASHFKIILKHLLPNLAGIMIINTMFTIPSAIFFEAFLSFIGLGLQAPAASLGTLIDEGYKSMLTYPHLLLFPAIILSILMICFNLVADGLRDALDPKMRD